MKSKLFGVVEGFYGKPYTFSERYDLITFLKQIGGNTYIYGPKSDPYHRRRWTIPYPKNILEKLSRLNEYAQTSGIKFIYALSPIKSANLVRVIKKIESIIEIGIKNFALFFDDIDVPLTGNLAEEQILIVNGIYKFLSKKFKKPLLLFCPTQYRGFKETEYIKTISQELHHSVKVFWTGNRVVAKRITCADIDRITHILKRPPLIWDNLFANDYIPGKIFKFPYHGRNPEIVEMVQGILLNPMNNYQESKPLLFTAFQFFNEPYKYHPRRAWQIAEKSALCRP